MLVVYLFFAVQLLAEIFFVFSLISFIVAKVKSKRDPGSYNDAEIKNRKTLLIVASVIFGVFLTVMMVIMALLFSAVAYM